MAATNPDYLPDPKRWTAFTVCLAAGFLALLNVSIVNVALPSIEQALDADPSHVQWIVASFALASGLVLVPGGRFGDLFGRRRMFLVGVIAFALASALCGIAPNADLLVAGRLLQGMAGGILNPQIIALIQELFRGPERARAFGMYGATVGISTAIGPMLGGVLIAAFGTEHGWRAVFWVNVPIGAMVLILAWRLLPRTRPSAARVNLDIPGLILLGVTVVTFMLPFLQASEDGLAAAPWWLLCLTAITGLAFGWWERRYDRSGGTPVITRELMRNRTYVRGVVIAMLYFAGFTGVFLLTTLYLQSGMGLQAWQAGLVLTPFAIAAALSAWRGGRWVTRMGRRLVIAGIALMIGGIVSAGLVLATVEGERALYAFAGALFIAGFGHGTVISPNQALSLATVPVHQAGVAGGAMQTGQRAGTSMGVATSGAVFFATLASTGDYGYAMAFGLYVVLTVLTLALLIAIIDQRARRRRL